MDLAWKTTTALEWRIRNMSKKQACKRCKYLFDGDECPLCKSTQTVPNWKGRVFVVDSKNSGIAKKIGAEADGEYAIKVS